MLTRATSVAIGKNVARVRILARVQSPRDPRVQSLVEDVPKHRAAGRI